MDAVKITEAQLKDRGRWDAYAKAHPDVSPYHLYAWRQAVEEAYGHKGNYLIAERNESVCGILPSIHMKMPLVCNQLVALPFCDVGDILADNAVVKKQLVEGIRAIAERLHCKSVQIRSQEEERTRDATDPDGTAHACKVRMLLTLPPSSEQLLSRFKSKLRSQVRKAEKNNLVFRWARDQDLDRFYAVFSKNMLDLGSPVHSKAWFRAVLRHYGSHCRMGLVELDKRTVGAGIVLGVGHQLSVPWASTLREYNHLSTNMMLYWNFLKYASDNRFRIFDFGRSSEDSGTYKFKKQWGAESVRLDWYEIDICGKPRGGKRSASSKRDFLAKIWSKFPLRLANILGPGIRKYINL